MEVPHTFIEIVSFMTAFTVPLKNIWFFLTEDQRNTKIVNVLKTLQLEFPERILQIEHFDIASICQHINILMHYDNDMKNLFIELLVLNLLCHKEDTKLIIPRYNDIISNKIMNIIDDTERIPLIVNKIICLLKNKLLLKLEILT